MRGALVTMGGSKLRKGFNSLAANAQRKPSPMLRGAAYFVNRKLAAAWMSWRAYSDEVMRLRRAASGLVHGPKRKAWNRWETFASEERVANYCHRPPPLPHLEWDGGASDARRAWFVLFRVWLQILTARETARVLSRRVSEAKKAYFSNKSSYFELQALQINHCSLFLHEMSIVRA